MLKKKQVLGTKKARLTRKFNLERNTYTLKFKDDHTDSEEIAFEDAMKLIPKSWWAEEGSCYCRMSLHVGGIDDSMRFVS